MLSERDDKSRNARIVQRGERSGVERVDLGGDPEDTLPEATAKYSANMSGYWGTSQVSRGHCGGETGGGRRGGFGD